MNNDDKWMQLAINEAKLAKINDEIPVGAVIIQNGVLISQAHNRPISSNDATAHAEIEVIRKAGQALQNYRLIDSTLYVTLEPCLMCLGAIIHARIKRIVFGAYDTKNPINITYQDFKKTTLQNHKIIINGGILEKNCQHLLQSFFKLRR